MSTKNLIMSLVGVIIIGTAVYFAMPKKSTDMGANTLPAVQTQQEETSLAKGKDVAMEPKKGASNDEIIDYIVDAQSGDETSAAQASMEEPSATVEEDVTISTNF